MKEKPASHFAVFDWEDRVLPGFNLDFFLQGYAGGSQGSPGLQELE